MTLSPSTIGLHRLYHQRITHPAFQDAGQVAAWLGAMQGQDYLGTKRAFGLRLPGSTDAQIERAIEDRNIVRIWGPRGTLHYVAPADIHWLVALVAPRLIAGNATRYRQLELDASTLTRSTDLIARALVGGKLLSRSDLFAMLEENGISTAGQRGVYMLQRAALERLIAQGPLRRNVTTFFALESGSILPKERAVAELARRYFISRGPATLADFVHWSGVLISEARAALADIKADLAEDKINGETCWLSPESAQPPERSLYLLPGFDEYVLGYRDRSAVLDPQYVDAICPGGNGIFFPTIVSEGRIVGTWKRTVKKKAVEIEPEPFQSLTHSELDAFEAAAAQYGKFLGLPAVILNAQKSNTV